jgi:hypothetical protein
MELKTYRVIVNADDDLTGVYAVSLVDQPAIEVDWIKLGKVEEFFFSANKDKQMLFGPLLIPNKLILRKAADGELFNIMFDAETIQIIADKYNENKINDIFNFQHSDKGVNAVLLQNWITGKNDKSQDYGFDLPEGTWFAGVKVKDEEFWMNEVKTDKVKGFSIEVKADVELIKMTSIVEDKNKNIKLMDYKTMDGTILKGDITIGADLVVVAIDGTETPAEGDYTLEDGTEINVIAGKVAEVSTPEEAAADAATNPGDMAITPDTTGLLEVVQPLIEELRGVIAELSSRLDKLENVETIEEETTSTENYRIVELEAKLEKLSLSAGAPSVTKKTDSEIKKQVQNDIILEKISFFKKK